MSAIMNSLPSYPVDQREVDKFLKCFDDDEERSFMEKTIGKIQHITFALLAEKLEECIKNLNPHLKNRNYAVGFAPEKSSEWIYDLVKDSLSNEPSSTFSLINTDSSTTSQQVLRTDISKIKENMLVILDDCGYTGHQLRLYLKGINEELAKRDWQEQMSDNISGWANKKTTVFVVIPFLSKQAIERARGFPFIDVKIVTSDYRINSFKEIYSPKEIFFFKEKSKNPHSPLSIFSDEIHNSLTLCHTAWRIPDSLSLLPHLDGCEIKNPNTGELVKFCILPERKKPYGNQKNLHMTSFTKQIQF